MLASCLAQQAGACSTFLLKHGENLWFGRNYDWPFGDALLLSNKRGIAKIAFATANPARWTSKYGSLTFNQYGREFPCGGINEAGLVIEVMWLDASLYPRPDQRAALNALQWVQYQLDTAGSVEEVIASDKQLRIQPACGEKLHFLIADRAGNCAAIEFLQGKLVVHTGKSLPAAVLTNATYEQSLGELQQHQGFGGSKAVPSRNQGGTRFVCAADQVRKLSAAPACNVDQAFGVLDQVAQTETQWRIVYDLKARQIHFRTRQAPTPRTVDLARFDFSPAAKSRMLDCNAALSGEVSRSFEDYRRSTNRELVLRTFKRTVNLPGLAGILAERASEYPETCRAVGDEKDRSAVQRK